MNYLRAGIGVLLGILLILMYELNIDSFHEVAQERELSNLTLLIQNNVENRFEKAVDGLESLTDLFRILPELGQQDFIQYAAKLSSEQCPYKELRFADSRTLTEYVYPPRNSDKHNPKSSAYNFIYAKSSAALRKAIETDTITVHGPFQSPMGDVCLAFLSPVFYKEKYRGILTGTVSISSVLHEIADEDIYENLQISIADSGENLIYGTPLLDDSQKTVLLKVIDNWWYMAVAWKGKSNVFPHMKGLIYLFVAAFILFLFIVHGMFTEKKNYEISMQARQLEDKITQLTQQFDEEKQAHYSVERALEKSEERYRVLFEHNPIETIVVDSNCRIVTYNFSKQKRSGRKPVIGTIMYKDFAAHHSIDMLAELAGCIQSGISREFDEVKYRDQYLKIHIAPFSDGAIITSIDNTSRKKLIEKLQQSHKMETVGTLAGGIADEFNNILGIILGSVELAIEETEDRKVTKQSLEEIQAASLRLKDVMRQLMSFSRQKSSTKTPIFLSEFIEDSINTHVRASISDSIDIQTSIQADVPLIMADPIQLQQILINLCTNSAQAINPQHGKITIAVEEMEFFTVRADLYKDITPGNYVVLTVSDDGCGIPKSMQERIFETYFTTCSIGGGTGMGLTTVYGIVKDHEADIVISSSENGGTTVSILFPPIVGHTPIVA